MEYETLDGPDLDMLIQGTTMTREKPQARVTAPPKSDEKKNRRILDALEGLPGKLEPEKA
jgi:cell division protease FtsH